VQGRALHPASARKTPDHFWQCEAGERIRSSTTFRGRRSASFAGSLRLLFTVGGDVRERSPRGSFGPNSAAGQHMQSGPLGARCGRSRLSH
jgi:hypothetical protein